MYISHSFANPLFPYHPKIATVNNFLLIFNEVQGWRLYTLLGIHHCAPSTSGICISLWKRKLQYWPCEDALIQPHCPRPSLH